MHMHFRNAEEQRSALYHSDITAILTWGCNCQTVYHTLNKDEQLFMQLLLLLAESHLQLEAQVLTRFSYWIDEDAGVLADPVHAETSENSVVVNFAEIKWSRTHLREPT